MRHMDIDKGEIVAVQGLGGLGHLAIQYANKMGYKVVALSSSGSKEQFARDLGASEYVDGSKTKHHEALQKLGGAALVISTAPNPEIMGELQQGLEPMGKLLLLSRKYQSILCPQVVLRMGLNCFQRAVKSTSTLSHLLSKARVCEDGHPGTLRIQRRLSNSHRRMTSNVWSRNFHLRRRMKLTST